MGSVMLNPVRMKKISTVVLEEKKDALLRELKERGLIEFLSIHNSDSFKDIEVLPASPSWVQVKASEWLSQIETALEVFKRVRPSSSSFVDELREEEIERVPLQEKDPVSFFQELEEEVGRVGREALEIADRLEALKKEREDLLKSQEGIRLLERLGIGPRDLSGYEELKVLVGTLPGGEVEGVAEDLERVGKETFFHAVPLDKKDAVMLVLFFREDENEVIRVLRIHRYEEFHISPSLRGMELREAASHLREGFSSIEKEETDLLRRLERIAEAEEGGLLQWKELLQVEKYLDESHQYFGKTAKTYVLCGWVPEDRVGEVLEIVRDASEGYAVVSVEDPEERDHPPTLLRNPAPARPLELLTDTYGSPSYHETDPTSLMALTFPLLFGLMFGDIGQGALMILLGYCLGYRMKLKGSVKQLGRTILLCGIFATLAGFLYGSILGLEGEHIQEFLGFEFHPLWLSPMIQVAESIRYALFIGIAFLVLGCLVNIRNELLHHKPWDALVSPYGVAGIWLVVGGTFFVAAQGLGDVVGAISGNLPQFGGAVIAPLALMTIGEWRVTRIPLAMSAFEAFENASRYLVNVISHSRIMILAIVHGALNTIMVTMMLLMPESTFGSVGKLFIFILGNLVILVMELFVSFIQTMRLHYYEWFSKFYKGSGKPFRPFKVTRKYTVVKKV
jgi:V/A-type H+-transporting ATPase subunit I